MNKKIKRESIEWVIIIVVFGTLYTTGLHTEAIGRLQSLIVALGIVQPDLIDDKEQQTANYEFNLLDTRGNSIDVRDFKHKTIFLNFWATWCPPCIAEMPDIHDLYEEIGNREDVEFILVSLDEDFSKAKAFVAKRNYQFPIYQMLGQRPEVFQSQSIPTTFIISKKGKIVAKRAGMAKYNTEKVISLMLEN